MRQFLKITSIFALTLVFTAGMAFGQDNTADVDQDGNDNAAEIEHLGGDNESTINQVGDNNNAEALVILSESQQSSTTLQEQKGNRNNAEVTGAFRRSGQLQGSFGATQLQDGNRNDAQALRVINAGIRQVQDGNDNVAYLKGTGQLRSDALQEQVGNENDARILRAGNIQGSGDVLEQEQFGDRNESIVRGVRSSGTNTTVIDVYQDGNANTANANFNGMQDNKIKATQLGNRNSASMNVTTQGNSLNVLQDGNDNTASYSATIP